MARSKFTKKKMFWPKALSVTLLDLDSELDKITFRQGVDFRLKYTL